MFIKTCLKYLKHHLLIITGALQKELNEINCPYSNDVNLIFTVPVHIETRMSGKIYISSTALVKSGKLRPKLRLFRVYMHAIR